MREKNDRSQASVEFLTVLGAILVIVAVIVYWIQLTAEGMGSDVEGKLENATSEVENLLREFIFRWA
jgi:uncharacterized protein (UPF0333 family)